MIAHLTPTLAALAAMLVLAAAPVAAQTPDLARIADELAIIRIANALDKAVDGKNWTKARSYFADQVRVDFSSLGAGPAATIPSDDLIGGWRANLGPKKTSLHVRGNHIVDIDGDSAVITSNGYAWNRMEGNGDPLWEVWGDYRYELKRIAGAWRITAFTFNMTHERGNMWVKSTPGSG
ncbi:nuclear transport factor 2 family protein [Terrarubrum flagellatum]|uniref:nuclear transport factor 2 family protein n=1 Tax=Terrirubrum flagellatum TaxID=2895980 RepID=UPI003144FD78